MLHVARCTAAHTRLSTALHHCNTASANATQHNGTELGLLIGVLEGRLILFRGPRARTPHWDWETGARSQHQRFAAGLPNFLLKKPRIRTHAHGSEECNSVAMTRQGQGGNFVLVLVRRCTARGTALYFLRANARKLLAQASPKMARFGPFFCAFLTAIASLISPKLCGPPTGLPM